MYSEKIPFWKNREFLVGNSAFLVAILSAYFFPKQANPVYDLLSYAVFFVLFPILAIRLILKQPLQTFGFGWGEWKRGLLLTLVGWFVLGGLTMMLFRLTHPAFEFFAPASIRASFLLLLIYMGVMAVILSGVEVLLRGLFMNIWARRVGVWAVLFQAVVFWIWIAAQGMPETFVGGCIAVTVPLWAGWIFWRSQSLWVTFLFSFGTSIIVSSLALIFL